MGRRFGRNQRRRLREQVAASSTEVSLANARVRSAERRASMADVDSKFAIDFIKQVVQVVGHQCILSNIEPPSSYRRDACLDGFRVSLFDRSDFSQPGEVMHKALYECMHVLRANVHVRNAFMRHIDMRVTLSNQTCAYTISDTALRDTEMEFLIDRIAPEIARQLIQNLRRQ